ncbi:unnamed protein product [Arctia plantaginis]|uniref:Uncharacterized protein n=1 Tax=Arctia plantaginis TaxID=874455 RepID=A0A8S1A8Y0_ARCPL|nr:unnamed protein product [Arctia plantaginis]
MNSRSETRGKQGTGWELKNTREVNEEEVNGFNLTKSWSTVLYEYGRQFAEYCISTSYLLYVRLTFVNLLIFLLKYVPTGFYVYKLVKDVYLTSRRRINERQMEMDDIQLQIKIVNTKLCFRDAEFTERTEQLQRSAERLRSVRARVRDIIANDEGLRHTLVTAAQWDAEHDAHLHYASKEQDQQFIVELIGEIKNVPGTSNVNSPEKVCSENAQTDQKTPENSVYSSLSDVDIRQDYRVKIVKVTNVYKVAYLKNFIKQKKLRRANKQALLKKKMENIKNLLEDWQKTLNMVINSKMTILNIDSRPMDLVSQEAMGDYSKPNGLSDSDSDLRNSLTDSCYDEYNQSWMPNQYQPYTYNYDGVPDATVLNDFCETQDCDGRYTSFFSDRGKSQNMMSIIEETNSEIAVEENKSEIDDEGAGSDRRSLTL